MYPENKLKKYPLLISAGTKPKKQPKTNAHFFLLTTNGSTTKLQNFKSKKHKKNILTTITRGGGTHKFGNR